MLMSYIPDPTRRARIERSAAAPHVDGLISEMIEAGYRRTTVQSYLRAAAHLSDWLRHRDQLLSDLDLKAIEAFRDHLVGCSCAGFERNTQRHVAGAKCFLQHLQTIGAVLPSGSPAARQPLLYTQF